MKYRRLGRTGFLVSEIGHGAWVAGSGSDDGESMAAVDLGCNFFDSAWGYGEGKSDTLLGQIIGVNGHSQDVYPRWGSPESAPAVFRI